ncbi:MAG: hypothetical protein AAGK23_06950 [Pseudomonadota bacterium]
MEQITADFDRRILALTNKNKRTVWFLMVAIGLAMLSYAVFLLGQFGILPGSDIASPATGLLGDRAGNALWAANNLANMAAGAALRVWFIREGKMTLLLTHAMVLDNEKDTALRVLLNTESKA